MKCLVAFRFSSSFTSWFPLYPRLRASGCLPPLRPHTEDNPNQPAAFRNWKLWYQCMNEDLYSHNKRNKCLLSIGLLVISSMRIAVWQLKWVCDGTRRHPVQSDSLQMASAGCGWLMFSSYQAAVVSAFCCGNESRCVSRLNLAWLFLRSLIKADAVP